MIITVEDYHTDNTMRAIADQWCAAAGVSITDVYEIEEVDGLVFFRCFEQPRRVVGGDLARCERQWRAAR